MVEIRETEDREGVFVVLHNGISDLIEKLNELCRGEYGRTCSLYRAFIAEKDPRSYDEGMKEFRKTGADMVAAVRDALDHDQERAFVRIELDTAGATPVAIDLIPGDQTELVADRIPGIDVGPGDTVVYIDHSRDRLQDELQAFLAAL